MSRPLELTAANLTRALAIVGVKGEEGAAMRSQIERAIDTFMIALHTHRASLSSRPWVRVRPLRGGGLARPIVEPMSVRWPEGGRVQVLYWVGMAANERKPLLSGPDLSGNKVVTAWSDVPAGVDEPVGLRALAEGVARG